MNSSSLMFRRRHLEQLGGFDTVRKAADTEFIRRLRAALPGRQILLEEALAFVRLTGGSLSRTDFKPGWNHPTRSEYAEAADWWHRSIFKGASARISQSPHERPFPAPQRFISAEKISVPEYDLVVAADFSSPLVVAGIGWELLSEAVRRGERVGVLPLDDPYRVETAGRTKVTDAARQLLNSGAVVRVFPEDEGVCGRLVLDDPAILEFADHAAWGLQTDRLEVLCHTGPVELVTASYWSHADCARMLADVLPGSEPTWVGTGEAVRQSLIDSALNVAEDTLSPAVCFPIGLPTSRRSSGRPVLGRIGSRARDNWPQTEEALLDAYPRDGSFDVRILGDLGPVTLILGDVPVKWLVYHSIDSGLDAFLAQLDIYVHASATAPTLLEKRVMIRAIGLGKPVICVAPDAGLPDGAAVTCAMSDVRNVVKELCDSHSGYQSVVKNARGVLEDAGLITVRE